MEGASCKRGGATSFADNTVNQCWVYVNFLAIVQMQSVGCCGKMEVPWTCVDPRAPISIGQQKVDDNSHRSPTGSVLGHVIQPHLASSGPLSSTLNYYFILFITCLCL